MSKIEYLIVPKGMTFMGSDKLGINRIRLNSSFDYYKMCVFITVSHVERLYTSKRNGQKAAAITKGG